jgi:multicomponent Na+:H+ antiporter subunit B
MRDSLFFRTVARFLFPSILVFSFFLFWRGHHAPGGGFIAGLLAAVSFAILGLAMGAPALMKAYRFQSFSFIRWGLLIAVLSGFFAVFFSPGGQYFQGFWVHVPLPFFGEVYLGSPLLFDFGVFLVVLGIGVNFILTLMED